jgi:hypothetical protein
MFRGRQERGLSDYFPFLFPSGGGAVLVIGAYFDESVREEGNEPLVERQRY